MVDKIKAIGWIVILLSITNYFGWTSIPWILIKIPAAIIAGLWTWAIILATIIVIKTYK